MASRPQSNQQNKPRKNRASRRRAQSEFDDTPDGIVKRIDAEIAAEAQEREAKRRASGHRWAPIMEPVFWLAMLAAALMVCSGFKLPQGLFGLSALSAALCFIAAYAVNRAGAVVERFPVRWFGRAGLVNGTSFSIAVGLLSVGLMAFALHRELN